MYKDVKKKLLSVALCICMIIGMVQVVPRAKAAADGVEFSVKGADASGNEKTFKVTIANTELTYNGGTQTPRITGIKEGEKEIYSEDKFGLVGSGTDVGTYNCYLEYKGGNEYKFLPQDATISYNIVKAVIKKVVVEKKDDIVVWKKGGAVPDLEKVSATLEDGTRIQLKSTQYTLKPSDSNDISKQNGIAVEATLSVDDTKNFDLDHSTGATTTVTFDEAFSLGGTIKDGTAVNEMRIESSSGDYGAGVSHKPTIQLFDGSKATNITAQDPVAVTYYKNGTQVSKIENAGEYKIHVRINKTPRFAKIGAYYYTGEYEGTYTVNASDVTGLRVVATDEKTKQPATVYGTGAKTLVYSYKNGNPVQLQNVQVWDGDDNVTDSFIMPPSFTGDTGVGNASMTLKPKEDSNYKSAITVRYFIASPIKIQTMQFEGYGVNEFNVYYNGKPILPKTYTVSNADDYPLIEGVDYSAHYEYFENGVWNIATGSTDLKLGTSGQKKLVVKGTGSYEGMGSAEQVYTIAPVSMEDPEYYDDFELTLSGLKTDSTGYYEYYKGSDWEPGVTFTYNGHELDKDIDYSVNYTRNVNVGTATVTVTALNGTNYAGSRSIDFRILPLELSKAKVIGNAGALKPENAFFYTGKGITPDIKLVHAGQYDYALKAGEDFEVVEYTDESGNKLDSAPTEIGKYKVIIRNLSTNINGTTLTLSYEIVKKNISSDPESSFILTGVNVEELPDGSVKRTIEWNGGETKPPVVCGTMVEGRDFTLAYNTCNQPGDAAVVITGMGNYEGEKILAYTITKRTLSNVNLNAAYDVKKEPGTGYKVTIKVTDKGEFANNYVLQQSSDYEIKTVTYVTEEDSTNYATQINNLPKAGEYEVVLEAASGSTKYTGTRTLTVGCGNDISKATFSIGEEDLTYDGTSKVPADIMLKIPLENGKTDKVTYNASGGSPSPFTLKFERKDDVSDSNATVFAGDVYIVAVGNPDLGYYGTTEQSGKYTIDPLNLPGYDPKYVIKIIDTTGKGNQDPTGAWTFPYTNEQWHPQIKVVNKNNEAIELSKNRDYDVTYDPGCTDQGDYNIIITGKGNYTGTIKEMFTIGKTPINDPDIVKIKWSNSGEASYAEGIPEPILKMGTYELVKGTDYTYTTEKVASGAAVNWENTYIFHIQGRNNFTGTREETYIVEKTSLVPANNADSWDAGQVYINRWDMDELMVNPNQIEQKKPVKFSLCYKKADGSLKSLEYQKDFDIISWGQNKYPGTDGNTVTIKGINGYSNVVEFPVTLYTDISRAEFITGEGGSTIVPDGNIPLSRLQEALDSADPSAALAQMVSLKTLWTEEVGGRIDPSNYTVTVDGGYTPKIGKVVFTISGTQQAPRYYGGSMQVSMTVTGALDSDQIRVEIGDNNTVEWQGEKVMPDNTKVQVYDGNKLLTGGYINAGASIPAEWDYTVTFSDNDGIGLATAIINGVNKYSESLTQKFKITCSMSNLLVKMQEDDGGWEYYKAASHDYLYKIDTTKNKPALKLFYKLNSGDEREVSKNLYSVTYNGYENAGNANAIIGEPEKEEYKGILLGNSRSISYTLKQIPMDKVIVALGNPTPTFTGNSMTATDIGLTITYGTYSLTDADYKLTFYNEVNTDAVDGAPAKVVITAKGNFSGIVEKEFNIQPMPIYSERDINASVDELIYTGTAQTPRFTLNQVTGRLRTLKEGTDYKIYRYLDETKTQQKETPYAEIGQYYIRIEGLGNYKTVTDSYRDIPYSIKERQMDDGVEISFVGTADCPVVNGMPDCVYDGKEHRPGIQVVYNQQLLNGPDAAKPDYDVTYTDNINAGTATITIKGNGSFAGQREVSFVIQPKDISSADMIFRDENGNTFQDEKTYEWTKNPVQPTISVYDTSMSVELVKGEGSADYTVKYSDDNDDQNGQYNAGKVTLTVYGTGNYGGTKEFTYYIGEDISKSYTLINGKSSVSVDYNGLVQAPAEGDIQVHWGASTDLTDENGEKRYDIAYYKDGFDKANKVDRDQIVDAGTYYVAVIGVPSKGTYAKSSKDNSCAYTVNPRSIAQSYILVSGYEGTYYYTGQSIEPKGITVEDTDLPVSTNPAEPKRTVKLTNGEDYELNYSNNTSAGKASIIVTGKGNYTGSRVAYFNIISSNANGNNTWDGSSEGTGSISNGTTTIAAADIKLGFDNSAYDCMMYNGYERIPTVSINGISTNEFIITASNNVRPGIATLMITGRGNNFTGTIVKNYKIKADLSTYGTIAAIADQVYTGYQITPHVTLTCGGNMLNQGSDYTVTYLNNTNVGVATVMATAANDSYYIGTARQSFNISNTAGGMEITGYASSYTYTGYAITPDLVVTMNNRVLNRGTDYVVSYSNNINVGTATMTVTGIGSYSGTKTINYTIEAKNIENCLTTAVTNYQYTGNTYTPNVTVTDSSTGKTLVAGTDYTITYSNNTNPGTASIMVTALSKNYTGSKVIPFKITSAAVSGLRTSAIKNNSMKLSWSAQDYADGYQICNTSNRVIATTSKNSYTVKGLTSCTTYKYKVRSYVENADGSISYGNFSTAVSAKTMLNTPKLTAKSTKKGQVTLTWTNVAKATGYEIYYSTKKNGIYTRLKTVSKSSGRKYVDSGLASGERYYYTIRAYRTANGVKTYSNYNTIKSVKVK